MHSLLLGNDVAGLTHNSGEYHHSKHETKQSAGGNIGGRMTVIYDSARMGKEELRSHELEV